MICRRCCCLCPQTWKPRGDHRQRTHSGSLTTETSQIVPRRASSIGNDHSRHKSKLDPELDIASTALFHGASTGAPIVSFADFLADTGDDDNQTNQELLSVEAKKDLPPTSNSWLHAHARYRWLLPSLVKHSHTSMYINILTLDQFWFSLFSLSAAHSFLCDWCFSFQFNSLDFCRIDLFSMRGVAGDGKIRTSTGEEYWFGRGEWRVIFVSNYVLM